MNIVLAPDSFKGNLTSLQVATAMEKGIHRVLPRARCVKVPMADGGEGTVQSLLDALGGKFVSKKVCGPDGRPVRARYGMLADGETAVIEMAGASGLPLLKQADRNPLRTTSYGTGELLVDALKRGASRIIVGIGGSATNDGGAGMAQALGVVFRDTRNRSLGAQAAGGMLHRIGDICMQGLHPGIAACDIVVATDVDNPLCGKKGASFVFGPQKGATPAMVRKLDANLLHFAGVVRKCLGKDVKTVKGAGAAGGLGAGLLAFTGAKIRSGVDIVIEATGLEARIEKADLVFTGEGRVDRQTAFGKTPAGVARAAKRYRVPVVAIGGGLADDATSVFDFGIDGLDSAVTRDMPLEEALAGSRIFISNAAERALRLILIGKKLSRR